MEQLTLPTIEKSVIRSMAMWAVDARYPLYISVRPVYAVRLQSVKFSDNTHWYMSDSFEGHYLEYGRTIFDTYEDAAKAAIAKAEKNKILLDIAIDKIRGLSSHE